MPESELRRQMRGSDAMFLYFERREMPLHIGAVSVLDGHFDEQYVQLLADRLHEIPRYRQRVLFAPYNLTHPFWEFDPDFSIHNHIRRVKLEPPGTDQQLSELSGQVFTPLMDRNKPLWDLTVVEGLENERSALIWRVHHSLVDGIAGVGLLNILFDATKTPRASAPAPPYEPPPLPDANQLLAEGLANSWASSAERLIGAQISMLKLAQSFLGPGGSTGLQALLASMPELLKPAEKLPFNRPCNGVRGHCWAKIPFGETRGIKAALGGTINDIVLTIVSEAVARYTKAHNEPVAGRFVRLMVPVNLRAEDPHGRTGNEISMLPVSIPLDIEDPAERLKVISQRTAVMKGAHVADLIHLIGTWIGWTPPGLQYPLAALPFLPQPVLIVNMVCTNVPGPMMPLYANGRELLTYYPHVPTGSDVGISVAVSSYNGNLFYGVTYDGGAAPDGELFRDFLVEAAGELRERAGVKPAPARASRAAAPATGS
jgi:diacylglycerol O-acyltransferase